MTVHACSVHAVPTVQLATIPYTRWLAPGPSCLLLLNLLDIATSIPPTNNFTYNDLEVVGRFKYLGCWLNWRCNLKDNITETFNKADKSLQQLQIKIICLGITDFKTMEHLFKSLIQPILLFNSEIWGIYKSLLHQEPVCTTWI